MDDCTTPASKRRSVRAVRRGPVADGTGPLGTRQASVTSAVRSRSRLV